MRTPSGAPSTFYSTWQVNASSVSPLSLSTWNAGALFHRAAATRSKKLSYLKSLLTRGALAAVQETH
eukprot:5886073-Pyramimonas_sp.AAC.1